MITGGCKQGGQGRRQKVFQRAVEWTEVWGNRERRGDRRPASHSLNAIWRFPPVEVPKPDVENSTDGDTQSVSTSTSRTGVASPHIVAMPGPCRCVFKAAWMEKGETLRTRKPRKYSRARKRARGTNAQQLRAAVGHARCGGAAGTSMLAAARLKYHHCSTAGRPPSSPRVTF